MPAGKSRREYASALLQPERNLTVKPPLHFEH
jgi:hypothetical protein